MSIQSGGYKVEKILIFWAESPVYAGSERGVGTIDLRLQRNIITGIPEIYATSLKGALRSYFNLLSSGEKLSDEEIDKVFGREDRVGLVSFLNLKILLFPVHSNVYNFVFVTSPGQLIAFARVLGMKGEDLGFDLSSIHELNDGEVIVDNQFPLDVGEYLYLSNASFRLKVRKMDLSGLINGLSRVISLQLTGYDYLLKRIKSGLVIMSDKTFEKIVNKALYRVTRIKLTPETKTTETGALFFQELLPEYTILFTAILLSPRVDADDEAVKKFFKLLNGKLVCLGGDESVGRGFVRIKIY